MKKRGLAFQLSVSILTVVLLIFVLVFIVNFYLSGKLMLKNVEENTKNLTSSAINKSEGFFLAIEKVALNLSLVVRDDPNDTLRIRRLLQDVVLNNEEVFGSCVAFAPQTTGTFINKYAPYYCKSGDTLHFANLASPSYNYLNWDWYRVPAQEHRAVWSEPYFDLGGGNEVMTTYSVPFYATPGDTSTFLGVITVDVSLKWLDQIVSNIRIFKTGYAFLISRKGVIITHPKEDYVMRESVFSLADRYHDEALRTIGEDMVAGKQDFVSVAPGFFEQKSWLYYTRLDNNNWSLAFVFPEEELYHDLHWLNRMLILIAGLGVIILFGLIMLIARRTTKPLRKLTLAVRAMGKGNLDVPMDEGHQGEEVSTLQFTFITMQLELRAYIAHLAEATKAREKVESEIKIARDIQMGMVPRVFPAFPNCPQLDVFAYFEPAKTVGGDLYDYFMIDDDHLFFTIGDVSGKGIPAAIFMAITTTVLRAGARMPGHDLKRTMDFAAAYLMENNEQCFFVTLFVATLNIRNGEMQYLNAGHTLPYIVNSNGQIEKVKTNHCIPLGIDVFPQCTPHRTILGSGDTLLLYTDGITEAFDDKQQAYAEPRLIEVLKKTSWNNAREMVDAVVNDVDAFAGAHEQDDDRAVLAIRFRGEDDAASFAINGFAEMPFLAEVQRIIERRLPAAAFSADFLFRINLVLEELLTNTLKYASGLKDKCKVSIAIKIFPQEVMVSVIDNAAAFDLLLAIDQVKLKSPDPSSLGGKGLLLIDHYTQHLRYSRIDGENNIEFSINR